MAAGITTPLIPFDTAPPAPTLNDIADDHSLLEIDQELDLLLEQIEGCPSRAASDHGSPGRSACVLSSAVELTLPLSTARRDTRVEPHR